MNIHRVVHGLRPSKPGIHTVIWLQDYNSRGTAGRHRQDPPPGGTEIEAVELAKQLVHDAAPDTVGILVRGGEPMEQAVDVAALLFRIKALRPEWSAGLVTGYTEIELQTGQYHLHDRPRVSQALRSNLWVNQMLPLLDYTVFDLKCPAANADADRPGVGQGRNVRQRVVLLTGRFPLDDFFRAAQAAQEVELVGQPGE